MAVDSIAGFSLAHSGAGSRPSPVEEEVTRLYDELRAPVLRYLFSLRVAPQDAEELVQETFLALFHHLRGGKSRANLRGWIFRVAHNTALKQQQRLRRADQVNPPPDLADPQPGPEEAMAAAQFRQQLLAVVNALPQQDHACLSLRAEGLRYREIAGVLDISLGSVAASLEKSLARLFRASKRGGN
jgi:RNA polymerase sigma-70 factor (ECF subfamily)